MRRGRESSTVKLVRPVHSPPFTPRRMRSVRNQNEPMPRRTKNSKDEDFIGGSLLEFGDIILRWP